jgi:hypothetical protein
MDYAAVERARERLETAAQARAQMAELGELAAKLEASLPERIGEAVQEGMRAQAVPVARQLAEVRGLASQTIRRLERIETDTLAERHARVDDLSLLVDLITSSWETVDERLGRIETAVQQASGAVVYRIEEAQERRAG